MAVANLAGGGGAKTPKKTISTRNADNQIVSQRNATFECFDSSFATELARQAQNETCVGERWCLLEFFYLMKYFIYALCLVRRRLDNGPDILGAPEVQLNISNRVEAFAQKQLKSQRTDETDENLVQVKHTHTQTVCSRFNCQQINSCIQTWWQINFSN